MNIDLQIERLILHGLPLAPSEAAQVQAAVEAELSHLLTAGGVASALQAGGALAALPGGAIQVAQGSDPATMGQQIAQAVYGGIGNGDGGTQ